jgi:hypothetical protein
MIGIFGKSRVATSTSHGANVMIGFVVVNQTSFPVDKQLRVVGVDFQVLLTQHFDRFAVVSEVDKLGFCRVFASPPWNQCLY